MKQVMIAAVIGVAILAGSSAVAEQAAPTGTGDSRGPRVGPPPEAYEACTGKAEGARAQFTKPDGEAIVGICRTADGRLVLRPDRPAGSSPPERRAPPPEAFRACEGKSLGSAAQLVGPAGEVVTGTCGTEEGKLVLRPDIPPNRKPRPADSERSARRAGP